MILIARRRGKVFGITDVVEGVGSVSFTFSGRVLAGRFSPEFYDWRCNHCGGKGEGGTMICPHCTAPRDAPWAKRKK